MLKSSLPFALLALLACSKKDPVPKEAPSPPPIAEKPAVVADASASTVRATKLGPIDLAATVLDLDALFPGATIELHPAFEPVAKAPPGAFTIPTVVVRDATKTIAELGIGADRVTAVNAYSLALAPNGIAGGASTAALASAAPNATCDSIGNGQVWCIDRADAAIIYALQRGGDGHTGVPAAKLDDTVRYVRWVPPSTARPTLAKMPPKAKR